MAPKRCSELGVGSRKCQSLVWVGRGDLTPARTPCRLTVPFLFRLPPVPRAPQVPPPHFSLSWWERQHLPRWCRSSKQHSLWPCWWVSVESPGAKSWLGKPRAVGVLACLPWGSPGIDSEEARGCL